MSATSLYIGCCCFLVFFRLCFAFELGFLQILPLRIVWRIADSPTSSVYDKTEKKKKKKKNNSVMFMSIRESPP